MHSTQIIYFASVFILLLALLFVNKCCIAKDNKKVFSKFLNIIIIVISLVPIANTTIICIGIISLIIFANDLPIKLKEGTKFYNKWLSRD